MPKKHYLSKVQMHALSFRSSPCIFGASGFRAIGSSVNSQKRRVTMATPQERSELDRRAKEGETVVPGGTGGKSLEAQENLAEGRRRGGSRGGQTRKEQLGTEGYEEMGRKGGLSTKEKTGGERDQEEGVEIDKSKFRSRQANE